LNRDEKLIVPMCFSKDGNLFLHTTEEGISVFNLTMNKQVKFFKCEKVNHMCFVGNNLVVGNELCFLMMYNQDFREI
jgi:sugar lactone lactonase YvrE